MGRIPLFITKGIDGNIPPEYSTIAHHFPCNYQEFLEDSDEFIEAEVEMERYLLEASYRIENYYFRDNLQTPHITNILAKAVNRDRLSEFVSAFIDSHSHQLGTAGPVHMFTFADKETSFLYNLFGLSKERILVMFDDVIKETYYGTLSKPLVGLITKSPHKLLITSILVDALQNNYEETVACCEYIMGFAEYPLMFRNSWKIDVDDGVMNYTMEHLKNKFKSKAKNLTTLLSLLKYDMNKVRLLCDDRLRTGMDHQYIDFIYRVRNQIKGTFKNIAREYYKNHQANATQHTKLGKTDEGHLSDHEGYMSNIASIVENTYSRFLSSGLHNGFVTLSAERWQVDKGNTEGYLNQIFTTKNNKLYRFIENMVTAYFQDSPTSTSVGSAEFLNFGLVLYRSIGTSKKPIYMEIRGILNMWMHDIIHITNYYQREGTIVNYTRAIFDYMVFMIRHHN